MTLIFILSFKPIAIISFFLQRINFLIKFGFHLQETCALSVFSKKGHSWYILQSPDPDRPTFDFSEEKSMKQSSKFITSDISCRGPTKKMFQINYFPDMLETNRKK